MQYSNGIIPEDNRQEILNYIDSKYNDLSTLISNIVSNVNSIQSNVVNIQDLVTQISNTIPSDLANTINNLGTKVDFELGVKDALSGSQKSANPYLLYELGYITGQYILNNIYKTDIRTYTVSPLNGNDTNDGINNPVQRLIAALNKAYYNNITKINITEGGSELIQEIYTLKDRTRLGIECLDTNTSHSIQFENLANGTKSKFIFDNIQKIVFKNIIFKQTDPIDTTNPLAFDNSIFYLENIDIVFIGCEFIYTGNNNTIWILAKNSRITIDNCIFPDTNTQSIFLASADGYPNELVNINSIVGNNTQLIDTGSNIIVR